MSKMKSLDKKASEDKVMKRVYDAIQKDYPASSADLSESVLSEPENGRNRKKKPYLTQQLPYGKEAQKVISKIYNILRAILPRDTAGTVISKIQEELKNTGRTE